MKQAAVTAITCRHCKKGKLYEDGYCDFCGKRDEDYKEKGGRAFSIVWQLFSSPFLSLAIALAAMYLWIFMNGGNAAIEKKAQAGPMFIIGMFNFVNISFVLVGILIIWAAKKKNKYKLGAYLLLIPMVLGTSGNVLAQYAMNHTPDAVNSAVSSVTGDDSKYFILDPKIIALADEIGIDKENLKKAKAQIGKPNNEGACGKIKAIGCFDGSIYIYPEAFSKDRMQQRSILAHEYLHYVWATASEADRNKLVPYLNIMYGKYSYAFDRRTTDYETSGITPGSPEYTNELHSFMGTEVNDAKLSSVLLEWYKKWLPNRNSLPSYL